MGGGRDIEVENAIRDSYDREMLGIVQHGFGFPGIADMISCRVGEVFAAARLGVKVHCEVRLEGDPNPEPASATLWYAREEDVLESFSLMRWQKYPPEPGRQGEFIGQFAYWGDIQVFANHRTSVRVRPGQYGVGYYRLLDPDCLGTSLFGVSDEGQKLTVQLQVPILR